MNRLSLSFFFLVLFLCSCGPDPMELSSSTNKELDLAIADRLSQMKSQIQAEQIRPDIRPEDVLTIHDRVEAIWKQINLFNACTEISIQADQYFDAWSRKLKMKKNSFLTIQAIDMKPTVIIAIKKNELRLLDELLFRNK